VYLITLVYEFYGKRVGSIQKKLDCLNFATIFRQQIICDCTSNIIVLTSVRVLRYLAGTARCFIG